MTVKPVPETDDDVPELLTWEAEIDGDEEEEDFEDELPADEALFADGADSTMVEEEGDDYDEERPAELPQPDRARSHPDLPKVKSNAFKRFIR